MRGRAIFFCGALALAIGGCPDYQQYGACDDATAAGECDDQNPCTIDLCGQGKTCTHKPAPDGNVANQVVGDCMLLTCRAGALINAQDDTDVHDDGESCTNDTCVAGKPTFTPVDSGTACTEGKANGGCVKGKCVVSCKKDPKACDDDEPCTTETCDTKKDACVFTKLDRVNTPGIGQTANDCHLRRCVDGKDTNVIDDTDFAATASDCDTEGCLEGAKTDPPLDAGTKCSTNGGSLCDGAGTCVGCNTADDCTALPPSDVCQTRTCQNNTCSTVFASAQTVVPGTNKPGDCMKTVCDGSGKQITVADSQDIPDDHNDCTTDTCNGTTPTNTPVAKDSFCGFALRCDDSGNCVGCDNANQCATFDNACRTSTCTDNQCGKTFAAEGTTMNLQTPGDCQSAVCDGAGNVKQVADNTDVPVDNAECTLDLCTEGIASNPPEAEGTKCKSGHCSPSGTCMECNSDAECPRPSPCVVGVCNNNKCQVLPINAGVIAPAPEQAPGDCQTIVCDGNGNIEAVATNDMPDDGKECTIDTCDGTTAHFDPIAEGEPCPGKPSFTCDGNGTCVSHIQIHLTGSEPPPSGKPPIVIRPKSPSTL